MNHRKITEFDQDGVLIDIETGTIISARSTVFVFYDEADNDSFWDQDTSDSENIEIAKAHGVPLFIETVD